MLAGEARLPRVLAHGRRPGDERRPERVENRAQLTSRIVSAAGDGVDERDRERDAGGDAQARAHSRRELRGLASEETLVELPAEG
ncbi:MAG TPA: hypothetical protein VK951_09870 [Miltoncostaeaceae bacterium]|nr:hypothetical protein [Miltoncostaeaceae bacterium]